MAVMADGIGPLQGNMLLYVAVAAGLVFYLSSRVIYDAFFGPLSKYPGPKINAVSRLPFLYNNIRGRNHSYLISLHDKYGPAVRTGPKELSFIGTRQIWDDVHGFRKQGAQKPFRTYPPDINGVNNIISADLPNHARMRRILSHAFSDRALREQEPILKSWVGKLLGKLSEKAVDGDYVDMLKFYNCTTFDVMGDLTFGENLNMLDNGKLSPWVETIFGSIKIGTIFASIKKIHPIIEWTFDNVIVNKEYVEQKKMAHFNHSVERVERRLARETDRPDFWTKILQKGDGLQGMSRGEHHSTASLFMIAGTETTATAVSGTTYYLLRNPDLMAKLQQELRSTFASFDDVTLDKLSQMKFLQAVLQEGLRMYPPVPMTMPRRTPKQGCEIAGEWVPGDIDVGIHNLATDRAEMNFTKPYEFHPERWLGGAGFENDRLDSAQPFSFGPQNCLGQNLAWHEMRLILASTLLNFDLELSPKCATWSDQKIYSLWEKVPLMCRLSPRKA